MRGMKRKRVMIIDDEADMLALMKGQLEVLYEVRTFGSGEEALAELEETGYRPQLIILDITMPRVDGYEVLRRLKENEALKDIPVVFLTGMTDEISECRGLNMDVVDYLKKPVAGKVLLARVQHYLNLYSDTSAAGRLDEDKIKTLKEPLSGRELEVARLMGDFRSDREICDILYISMPYTKNLVSSVKKKLGLEKRGDIRRYLV